MAMVHEKIGININKKPDYEDEIELASDDIPVFGHVVLHLKQLY